ASGDSRGARLDASRFLSAFPEQRVSPALASLGLAAPEIEAATEVRWRPGFEDEWRPRFARAARAYAEMEYLTVKNGVRRVMFCTMRMDDPFMRRVRADGLFARALFHVKPFTGFAHKFDIVDSRDPRAAAHIVVARREPDVEEAARVYGAGLGVEGHARLGELLGFPSCCREHFAEHFVRRRIPDPLLEAASATRGARKTGEGEVEAAGYPECNQLLRYFGLRAVSWLPCSFRCRATRAAAGSWLEIGRAADREGTEDLLRFLSQDAQWAASGRTLTVRTPAFVGKQRGYPDQRRLRLRWSAA
ncbi:MAG TPA: hypothetical protein VH309_11835, partial [Elusimicrobiota bacterium]|nr:hypothetical protein [Elusimicrobiota bacterium]